MRIAFFGTPMIAVYVLEELAHAGIRPNLIITNPDAPQGRKQILTPPPAKTWAAKQQIAVLQPTSLKDSTQLAPLLNETWDLFIVAAYGKIMPQAILDLPQHGTLNVHPSLLPKLRGASPIRSAILADERDTGVTIMQMDAELDHGPIIAQEGAGISAAAWPLPGLVLDEMLARQGGRLLAATLPRYLAGSLTPQEQDHNRATFCTKITKEMGRLEINPLALPTGEDAYQTYLKICAFDGWPETYFLHNNKRIKIKKAELASGQLRLLCITPEGKSEIDFSTWLHSAAPRT